MASIPSLRRNEAWHSLAAAQYTAVSAGATRYVNPDVNTGALLWIVWFQAEQVTRGCCGQTDEQASATCMLWSFAETLDHDSWQTKQALNASSQRGNYGKPVRNLETLEKLYDEIELASYIGVLVLWPSEDKVTVSTEQAIKAAASNVGASRVRDAAVKFPLDRDYDRGPEIPKIIPKESHAPSAAIRPSEAAQVQRRERWTALALKGRFLVHLEEDTYRRLGLIGRGHNPRVGRKRQRHPVYGDGAFVVIDLGQASSRPDSKYHKRIHTCLGRIPDTFLWQIASLDGVEAPLVAAPDSQRKIAARIRTGITTSPLSTARRQRQSADRNVFAQTISTVMDAIGQLMLGIDEQQERNDEDECQYYLKPLSVDDDPEAATNERAAFHLYEWGADKRSLLPHRWYQQIVPIVWALHLASVQTPLDLKQDQIEEERKPTCALPRSTNVFGFFGWHHDQAIYMDDDRNKSASIPFVVCEQLH
ncbi:hypothetical protein F1559_003410 [Cyanidiococcus yangmingshanensis]|uniref:Uncharacterized protein n=1 Tax=Cyanidiococcus yangmingshanensis TaxID=2690220 RepID=A0A7J7IN09_9RHOD|nr:hypothetical protein F1559_003410 [Cyanidiococcus yangmingshanensis]